MDKEALLNIILNDLKEVETLVISFQGKTKLEDAFINLTERKLSHISEELAILKSLSAKETEHTKSRPILYESAQQDISIARETKDPRNSQIKEKDEETILIEHSEPEKEIIISSVPDQTSGFPKSTSSINHPKPNKVAEQETIKEEKAKTLGESFIGEKKSVNDIIASNKNDFNRSLIGKPIKDLTKGLGINDRFLYQRELFSGNADFLMHTLQQINELPDYNSASRFITSNFQWDYDSETTQSFMNYIKRKF